MTTRITTSARSPLGQWLALAAITALLLLFGYYLYNESLKPQTGLFGSAPARPAAATQKVDYSALLTESLRRFGPIELIAYYGIAIIAGFMIHGFLGRFLRSYRYRFLPAKGIIERREMWLFIPVWAAAWVVLALPLYKIAGPMRTVTLWLPVWLIVAVAAPGLILWLVWAWIPNLLEGRTVRIPLKFIRLRVPVWVLVAKALVIVLALVGLIGGWRQLIQVPAPLGLILALLIPPVLFIPAWFFAPALTRRNLFIPGLGRRIPFSRIKRLEVQASADGGTALVLTFRDDWTWTLCRGSPQRLQRLGATLGRAIGLPRRDLVTWG